MNKKIAIQIVAGIVVSVFAIGIWLSGDKVELGWLRFYSLAVMLAVLTSAFWDHWLWRNSLVQKLHQIPRDLRGTWKGTLRSFWVDPETGKSPPEKAAYLVIRQTFSSISVVMFTDEMRSKSSYGIVTDDGIESSLVYIYISKPDARLEHRSRMHHGSTSLEITSRPAIRMKGRYWTDRDSRGELEFDKKVLTLAEDYQQAVSLFN